MDACTGAFLFLSGKSEERERFRQLAECQSKYSQYTFLITDEEGETDGNTLRIRKTGAMYTEVFEIVVIPQYLAAVVQGYLGIADGSPLYDEYTALCPTKFRNGK